MSTWNSPDNDPGSLDDTALREPKMFRIFLHNDDYTTMEFVIQILVDVFHKNGEQASAIMLEVHEKGTGLCGVYTQEIAETKLAQVHARSRKAGFPLRCSLEEVKA